MISKNDLKIISHLRKNARVPLTKMSREINIPVSTIFDRLKLTENSFITKHTCLLDFDKLGYTTRANINIRVHNEDKDNLREYLMKSHNINTVYKINNGYDFMVETVFRNIKEMDDFLENLEARFNIIDKATYFIVKDLKKEEFMSSKNILDII